MIKYHLQFDSYRYITSISFSNLTLNQFVSFIKSPGQTECRSGQARGAGGV